MSYYNILGSINIVLILYILCKELYTSIYYKIKYNEKIRFLKVIDYALPFIIFVTCGFISYELLDDFIFGIAVYANYFIIKVLIENFIR